MPQQIDTAINQQESDTMKLQDIKVTIGGDISDRNSKMPGATFGHSTDACGVGGKLRAVEGSTCHKCYARRIERMRPNVAQSWAQRTEAIREACSDTGKAAEWVEAMVQRIDKKCQKAGPYFRWHDSGDLLSVDHLYLLVQVAERLPHISFWLPTREKAIVSRFIQDGGRIPENLTVRLSAAMVDGKAPRLPGVNTSTVHKHQEPVGHECPTRHQGNACGDCRACWDKAVGNVSYPLH